MISGRGEDEITDCLTTANKGVCQVTFGDLRVEPDGTIVPVESVITGPDDVCTCQCLDYIFLIRRKHQRRMPTPYSSPAASQPADKLLGIDEIRLQVHSEPRTSEMSGSAEKLRTGEG